MASRNELESWRNQLHGIIIKQGHTEDALTLFRTIVCNYFGQEGRNLPWRQTIDPYQVFVSEIMLQQTQVERVISKFTHFIGLFPSFEALAAASLPKVLEAWQGLGYNRRALNMKKCAERIVNNLAGILPHSPALLQDLPGIGRATAASIAVFGYNRPEIFIEINIRCVFLFFFFYEKQRVHDQEIVPLVQATLDQDNPCRWYSALMDLGTNLRKHFPDIRRQSVHYHRQPPFQGSDRQVRSKILRLLLQHGTLHFSEIQTHLPIDPTRLTRILKNLQKEGFILSRRGKYTVSPEVKEH
ncbi:MarR family transcriptional regulator [bacterium]|nr:MarR family transcriptional regulator [bacterium]